MSNKIKETQMGNQWILGIAATISLEQVRQARKSSRNLPQRRPELYGEIVTPVR